MMESKASELPVGDMYFEDKFTQQINEYAFDQYTQMHNNMKQKSLLNRIRKLKQAQQQDEAGKTTHSSNANDRGSTVSH